jgi:hypothetical protein
MGRVRVMREERKPLEAHRARTVIAITFALAFAVFCIVQDRITAEGARRYVTLQREALAGRGPYVTIEEIMQPAIDRSVRGGLLAAGGVVVIGGLLAWRQRL